MIIPVTWTKALLNGIRGTFQRKIRAWLAVEGGEEEEEEEGEEGEEEEGGGGGGGGAQTSGRIE